MSFDEYYALALNAARGVDPNSTRCESQLWVLRNAMDALISHEEMGVARSLFQRAASEYVRREIDLNALMEIGRKVGRTAQVEVASALRQCMEKEGLSFTSLEELGVFELRKGERSRLFYYLNLDMDLLWDVVSTLRDQRLNSEAGILEAGLMRFESIVGPFEGNKEPKEALTAAATVG